MYEPLARETKSVQKSGIFSFCKNSHLQASCFSKIQKNSRFEFSDWVDNWIFPTFLLFLSETEEGEKILTLFKVK